MTGTAAAEGQPSGMFVAHAAAITEVWLALVERGPAVGVEVIGWLTDRAGWQEWTRAGRYSSHPSRLTPDAVATLTFGGTEAVAFVEVDLASMTQTVLKQKVARYLAYADDLVWQDRYPYCPPMLLLTTTAIRAVSFRQPRPPMNRYSITTSRQAPQASRDVRCFVGVERVHGLVREANPQVCHALGWWVELSHQQLCDSVAAGAGTTPCQVPPIWRGHGDGVAYRRGHSFIGGWWPDEQCIQTDIRFYAYRYCEYTLVEYVVNNPQHSPPSGSARQRHDGTPPREWVKWSPVPVRVVVRLPAG